jgi:hypothetical protein
MVYGERAMSDWIEVDGKKYFEESYLILANNNSKRRGERIQELEAQLKRLEPKPHWSEASKSLVNRLRGIYAVGPNADQMGPNNQPEFGWREFPNLPPIQYEAAAHIEKLEEELYGKSSKSNQESSQDDKEEAGS